MRVLNYKAILAALTSERLEVGTALQSVTWTIFEITK
jgi:hypothetical protein